MLIQQPRRWHSTPPMQAAPQSPNDRQWLQRLASGYRVAALVAFNTLVLLLLLNLGACLLTDKDQPPDMDRKIPDPMRVFTAYGVEKMKRVYPHRDEAAIRQLQKETWGRELTYEPFTEFKEAEFSGAYVNVSPEGCRRVKEQAPWPPSPQDFCIFVFGGSTTFGYGVADDETVPSRLQETLRRRHPERRVSIYNFGRGFYYSVPERVLFEKLLVAGFRPQAVLFIDGLNEFENERGETKLSPRIDRALHWLDARQKAGWTELFPLVTALRPRSADNPFLMDSRKWHGARRGFEPMPDTNEAALTRRLLQRYLANREIIRGAASQFNIRALFVWQPVPGYHADPARHPVGLGATGEHPLSAPGYAMMQERLKQQETTSDFLWCAELHEGQRLPLYVDSVHYSAAFCEAIANTIATTWLERGLLRP